MANRFGKSRAQLEAMSKDAVIAEAERIFREADNLDLRRQAQIANQIGSINRLLKDGSYDREMEKLHEDLVERDHKLGKIRVLLDGIYSSGQLDDLSKIVKILNPEEVSDGDADAAPNNA